MIFGVHVQSKWSVDTFHEKDDRIYRVVETQCLPSVEEMNVAVTIPPLAPLMEENFPEIQSTVRIIRGGIQTWRYEEKNYSHPGFVFADSSIFDIFTFPMLAGDANNALKRSLFLSSE